MQKRIEWVDIAKGIGIIIVVLGHMSNKDGLVGSVIWAFHMPLFFFLSGLFLKPESALKASFLKRVRQLLWPCLVFSIIACMVAKFVLDMDLSFLSRGLPNTMWFLTTLFLADMLSLLLLERERENIWLLIAANLILAFVFEYEGWLTVYSLSSVFIASFYLLLGYKCKNAMQTLGSKMQTWKNLLYGILSAIVLVTMVRFLDIHTSLDDNMMTPVGVIASFVGILMVIFFSKAIDEWGTNKELYKCFGSDGKSSNYGIMFKLKKALIFWGVNSLAVMVTHQIFIKLYSHFFAFDSHMVFKSVELIFVFTCCLLSIFILRGRLSFLIGKR